jgi:hypothetical protein
MTSEKEDKKIQTLEEICENTRAIRRVVNRILDHLHEYGEKNDYMYWILSAVGRSLGSRVISREEKVGFRAADKIVN